MVYTADIRVGAVKISMNTNWADDYIHDCLRYERGEDTDECELYELYTMIENELDKCLEGVVRFDDNFDTYDFFECWIGNNATIMNKMERVLVEVKDEEEKETETLADSFKRVATEMSGGMAKVSVNF